MATVILGAGTVDFRFQTLNCKGQSGIGALSFAEHYARTLQPAARQLWSQ
jgi:hypothetical protein